MRYVLLLLLTVLGVAHATTISIGVVVVNPLAFTQTSGLTAPVSSSTVVGTISGGTGPYSVADTAHFSVSGSNLLAATTLAAGQYPTTLRDSGSQQLMIDISIGVGNAVTFTAAKTLVAPLASGTIVGTIAGGITPYVVNDTTDFSVSGSNLLSAKTLTAGSYPITITDHAGTTVSPTIVVVPALGFAPVSLTAPVSPGSTVGTISGGTSPFTVADTVHFSVSSNLLLANATLSSGTYPTTLNDSGGQSLNITVAVSSPVTFTQVQPLAAPVATGGLIGTISGGTAPYTVNDTTDFSVSGGNLLAAKTLVAGNYPITINDSVSGSVNATVVIASGVAFAQVNPLVATVPTGTIVGNIAGGVTPYHVADTTNFAIVNTTQLAAAQPLAAGSYPTTLTDSSSQSQAITVLVETPVAFSQSTTLTTATPSSTTAGTISGGVAPYVVSDTTNFSVSGSNLNLAQVLAAGNYPITITDSLGATASVTLVVYAPLTVQVASPLTGPLAQGRVVASISGGNGPYTVSDTVNFMIVGSAVQTATTVAPGNYSIIITDSSLPHALNASVTIPVQTPVPPLSFAQVGLTSPVPSGTLVGTISGGVAPYSVSDTVNFAVSGSNLNAARILSGGAYPITITDSASNSINVTINVTVGSTSVSCNQIGTLTAPLAANTTICMIVVVPSNWMSPPGIFNLSGNDANLFYVSGFTFRNSTVLSAGVYTVTLQSVP